MMSIHVGTPATHTHAGLISLPTELIVKIFNSIPFESHIDLALACRRLADCASNILRRHRDANHKYRVASDRDPATVLTLLRSVFGFGDPILAWHVRGFESWDLRRLIQHDGFPEAPRNGPYRYADGFEWAWYDSEVNAYLRIFQEASFPTEQLDALRRDIRDQHDGALKMVLFATLPRLRDLKLARSFPSRASGLLAPHEPYACLGWLQTVIENGMHQELQATGLLGLESLAIGVKTGEEADPSRSGGSVHAKLLLQLMRLPRLSSLYLHRLNPWNFDEDDDYPTWRGQDGGNYGPEPGSSTVRHLYLDGLPQFFPDGYVEKLAAAPQALKTVALRNDDDDDHVQNIGDHLSSFFRAQPESLESMMVYNPEFFRGYRSSLFYPDELERDCHALQFSHDVADHLLCAEEPTREAFVRYFCEAMSSSLKVLVLHGDEHYTEIEDCEDPIDEAVTALLNSNELDLKTVYLCGFEQGGGSRMKNGADRERVRFQKSITAGIKWGVDVVTRTTRREDLVNGEPSFPRAVDRYDLMTGRFGGKRPPEDEGRLFDPVSGIRRTHLCDHCGNCDACLALYPREMWEKAREERAWAMARDDWTESEYSDEEEGGGSDDGSKDEDEDDDTDNKKQD